MTSNERPTDIFRVLGDRGRYRVTKFLARRERASVTEVAKSVGVSVPVASQQLRMLLVHGLANRERRGQKVYYSLTRHDAFLKSILNLIR